MAMMGWMLARRASLTVNRPSAEEAPYTISGVGGEEAGAGDHGGGRAWRRKRVMAAVVDTKGIVEAFSKETLAGMWNVVCAGAMAYSAYAPPEVPMGWKAATRSPMLKPWTNAPTAWTVPAMSSPELNE